MLVDPAPTVQRARSLRRAASVRDGVYKDQSDSDEERGAHPTKRAKRSEPSSSVARKPGKPSSTRAIAPKSESSSSALKAPKAHSSPRKRRPISTGSDSSVLSSLTSGSDHAESPSPSPPTSSAPKVSVTKRVLAPSPAPRRALTRVTSATLPAPLSHMFSSQPGPSQRSNRGKHDEWRLSQFSHHALAWTCVDLNGNVASDEAIRDNVIDLTDEDDDGDKRLLWWPSRVISTLREPLRVELILPPSSFPSGALAISRPSWRTIRNTDDSRACRRFFEGSGHGSQQNSQNPFHELQRQWNKAVAELDDLSAQDEDGLPSTMRGVQNSGKYDEDVATEISASSSRGHSPTDPDPAPAFEAGQLLLARDPWSEKRQHRGLYYPARVEAYCDRDAAGAHLYDVLFMDGVRRRLTRENFYTDDDEEFASCKLGGWLSNYISAASQSDGRDECDDGPDCERLSRPFELLDEEEQFNRLKPVLSAIMSGKFAPSDRHQRFLQGGKARQALQEQAGISAVGVEESKEALLACIVRWVLGNEHLANVRSHQTAPRDTVVRDMECDASIEDDNHEQDFLPSSQPAPPSSSLPYPMDEDRDDELPISGETSSGLYVDKVSKRGTVPANLPSSRAMRPAHQMVHKMSSESLSSDACSPADGGSRAPSPLTFSSGPATKSTECMVAGIRADNRAAQDQRGIVTPAANSVDTPSWRCAKQLGSNSSDPSSEQLQAEPGLPAPPRGDEGFEALSEPERLDYCTNVLLPEAVLQLTTWLSGKRQRAIFGTDEEERQLYEVAKARAQPDWVLQVTVLRNKGEKRLRAGKPSGRQTNNSLRARHR